MAAKQIIVLEEVTDGQNVTYNVAFWYPIANNPAVQTSGSAWTAKGISQGPSPAENAAIQAGTIKEEVHGVTFPWVRRRRPFSRCCKRCGRSATTKSAARARNNITACSSTARSGHRDETAVDHRRAAVGGAALRGSGARRIRRAGGGRPLLRVGVHGTTVSCSISNQPAAGDVILMSGAAWDGTNTVVISSVSDGTNTFTNFAGAGLTSGCSTTFPTTASDDCGAWLIEPNGSGGKTFTLTVSGTTACGVCTIRVDRFAVTGGTAAFDFAAGGSGTTNTLNSPTIAVSGANELIWGGGVVEHAIAGVTGSWTEEAHGEGDDSDDAEYQLNVSANTAVGFTESAAGDWSTTGIAFKFTPSGGGGCTPTLTLLHVGRCS